MRSTVGSRALVGVVAMLAFGCGDGDDGAPDGGDGSAVLPDGAVPGDAAMPLPPNVTRLHEPRSFAAGPSAFADGRIADGRLIARAIVAADETVHVAVLDPVTGATRDVSGGSASVLWHGRDLSIYVAEGALYALDGPDGTPRRLSGSEVVSEAWFTADEQRVLYAAAPIADAPRELFAVRVDGSDRHQLSASTADRSFVVPGASAGRSTRPRMSPDGRRAAFLVATEPVEGSDLFYNGPFELHTVALDPSGAPSGPSASLALVADSRGSESAFQFEFSADGTRLVFATRTGGIGRLFTTAFDGAPPTPIAAEMPVREVVMSPDRAHVVLSAASGASGRVQRVAPDGSGLVTIVESAVVSLAVGGDSRFVYYDGRDDRLRAAPIGGGAPIELQPAGSERDRLFVPLDDGRAIFTVIEPGPPLSLALVLADPAAGSHVVLRRDPIDPRNPIVRNSVVGVVAGRVLYASVQGTPPVAPLVTTLHAIALDGSGAVELVLPSPHGQAVAPTLVAATAERAFLSFDGSRWTYRELHAFDLASGAIENLSARAPQVNYADVSAFTVGASGRTIAASLDHHFSTASLLLLDRQAGTDCMVDTPITPSFSIIDLDLSSDESALAFAYAPNGPWTAYRASTSDCSALALNTLLPADPGVRRLRISPDSQWTVVEGEQLWAIRAGTSQVVQLTNLAPGTRIRSSNRGGFAISPDSQRVAYLVENIATEVVELYAVGIDGSNPTKLNPTLPAGATVFGSGFCAPLRFTPDSRSVVYAIVGADQRGALYRTRADGADPIRLSGVEAVNTDDVYGCRTITISPDGARVVYAAQPTAGNHALHSVGIDGGPVSVLAQAAGPATGSGPYLVVQPIVTGDSQTVIYAESGSVWAVGIDGSQRRRLSETSYAYRTTLSRDGSRVVFLGQANERRYSLFSAPLDGSGALDLTPAEPSLDDPGDTIPLTADGLAVYLGASSRPFAVPITGGAVIPLLPEPTRTTIRDIGVSPSGDAVFVRADLERRGVIEVFEVAIPR